MVTAIHVAEVAADLGFGSRSSVAPVVAEDGTVVVEGRRRLWIHGHRCNSVGKDFGQALRRIIVGSWAE
jgi:hypothetical protein